MMISLLLGALILQAPASENPDTGPRPGDIVVVDDPSQTVREVGTAGTATPEHWAEFGRACEAGDAEGILEMYQRGRLLLVPYGTRLRVLTVHPHRFYHPTVECRILSIGPWRHPKVWVQADAVRPAAP